MKKIVKEFNVYEYNELNKDIQENILNEQIGHELELYCDFELENDLKDVAKTLLETNNFKYDSFEVYYDLSYSQCGGAMITFNTDILKLNDKYNILSKEELDFVNRYGIYTYYKIYHRDPHYYHENSFDIDYSAFDFILDEEDEKIQDNINKKQNELYDRLYDDIYNMNKEFTKKGYELINTDDFKDVALDFINDSLYYENGKYYGEKED